MNENIAEALSAPTAATGCAQKVDNHQWPLSMLWMQDKTKMSDLHAQLEGRLLWLFLVHKHNAGERYGFRACKFQTGKSESWEEKETEEEPVQRVWNVA
eukprot:12064061-Karenia_brevis.AAC.1